MIGPRNKPYGIRLRKLDYPSTCKHGRTEDDGHRYEQSGGGGRPAPQPTLVTRSPDGTRKKENGARLRFRGVSNSRSLRGHPRRQGKKSSLFDFCEQRAPFALMGAPGYLASATVCARVCY